MVALSPTCEIVLDPLFTSDGRYLIVRDRLWRASDVPPNSSSGQV